MSTIDEDGVVHSPGPDRFSPDWPPQPTNLRPMPADLRGRLYGTFTYVPQPTPSNPEGIFITGMRDFSIRAVQVPQSWVDRKIPGIWKGRVYLNSHAADSFLDVVRGWESEGLLDLILSWDGGYAPRFVRGSRTSLSNHSWGTAFDINARWNMIGKQPALHGDPGAVRALVGVAASYGWWWGGWGWPSAQGQAGRLDGMHFEVGERF